MIVLVTPPKSKPPKEGRGDKLMVAGSQKRALDYAKALDLDPEEWTFVAHNTPLDGKLFVKIVILTDDVRARMRPASSAKWEAYVGTLLKKLPPGKKVILL
jgi:hypothetical protein